MQTTLNDRVKLEDLFFPEIYLSLWISHAAIEGSMYENTSLSVALFNFQWSMLHDKTLSWLLLKPNPHLNHYFYAGAQEKWVWMNRVSINDPIPFTHRTVGITRRIEVHGEKVYWREPKNK